MLGLLLIVALSSADAGMTEATELAPVDVPITIDGPPVLPTSPVVRDPSATVTIRDATTSRAEAKDASELVATTPGTYVQDSGGAGQRKTLSLRGAAPNAVLVLLDGVPLAHTGAATDLSRIPTAALDHLEILRGGGGRYGPGALGGVVNLVTKAPDGRARVFADVTQGSFVTTQVSAGGATKLFGGDGLVLLHGLRSEGTFDYQYDDQPGLDGNALTTLRRVNNGALQGGGLLRFRRRLGNTQLDLLGEGFGEQKGLAGPVQNPTPTSSQSSGRGTLAIRTETQRDDTGTWSTLTSLRVDDTTLRGSYFGTGTYHQLEGAAQSEVTWSKLFDNRHQLTVLGGAGTQWLSSDAASPLWGRAHLMPMFEEFFFDGVLSANASARVDLAGPFVVVSPKAGLVAELPYGFSLRASGGQASRAPSFSELYVVQGTLLPNPNLRPERALTADLGAAWTHEKGSVSANGFFSLYEDLISYEYYPPNLARPFNFQAARVAGVEVEGEVTPWPWLKASASYTFLHSQNLKDDPRYYLKSLPFRPQHRVHARIAGGPWWLQGHAEVLYQSMQFTNRTETTRIDARVLLNLGVTVTPWKNPRVSLSAEVKNLLDVFTQDLDGYPLPPRAFFVTIGIAWEPVATRDSLVATR